MVTKEKLKSDWHSSRRRSRPQLRNTRRKSWQSDFRSFPTASVLSRYTDDTTTDFNILQHFWSFVFNDFCWSRIVLLSVVEEDLYAV